MKLLLTLAALAITSSASAQPFLQYLVWSGDPALPTSQHDRLLPEAMIGGYHEITVGGVALSLLVTDFADGATMDVDGILTVDGIKQPPFSISYTKSYGYRVPTQGVHRIYDDGAYVMAIGFEIPEPATWGLMGTGCLAIVALRRRARSR